MTELATRLLRSNHLQTYNRAAGLLIAGVVLAAVFFHPVHAQDNGDADTLFAVTVLDKTSDHPHFEDGFPEGYAIDGEEGSELTLERGQTYYFVMEDVPSHHPFYITTNEDGAGEGQHTDGVSSTLEDYDDRAYGEDSQDTLKFTPSDDAPDLLYYNCTAHDKMGFRVNIVDPTSTDIGDQVARQEVPSDFVLQGNYPNPFNPTTTVQFDLPTTAEVQIEVYDMLGRPVKSIDAGQMAAGTNQSVQVDASSLASGIYLYRVMAVSAGEEMMATGRMMLVK